MLCGAPVRRRCLYCSRACRARNAAKARPVCARPGCTELVRAMRCKYCSRDCASEAQIGVPASGLTLQQRFWSKVTKRDDRCWVWATQSLDRRGYGVLQVSGNRQARATALAWEMTTGTPVPAGKILLHTCDNPACVRNDDTGIYRVGSDELPRVGHLALGTHAQNNADAVAKRRHAFGERNGRARLTARDVALIRGSHEPSAALAARYRISQSAVLKARQGVTWARVTQNGGAS